jgi:hypothetical protein
MRLRNTQFTVRRMLIAIALVSLLLGFLVQRERRVRTLDRIVVDQDITMYSAEANVENVVLAREAAERSLGEFLE